MRLRGTYFGTEVEGSWWRRYGARGFFARGVGEFWLDDRGLHFLKSMTKNPLVIAWHEVGRVELGRWHSGRWGMGRPILKVHFTRDGKSLVAGFTLSPDWDEMGAYTDELQQRLS